MEETENKQGCKISQRRIDRKTVTNFLTESLTDTGADNFTSLSYPNVTYL